ncbi:putative protein MSS51 homolog, mitochondrial [Protopterus annectens]|uniref:putative protein MSS51 homolog, mitochondrial n=1 Tax=Protopterus annectens TaxID=7888 RepID=UPI001CF9501F|nr:putative protein MSS51 homolog, mitochondrial [Protopterus annectens]XP_043936598.1 putative protein MSS51 homolog, mitochondrial [Protopterus annectens]
MAESPADQLEDTSSAIPKTDDVAGVEGVFTDSLGFLAMDSNVPGLSHVILQKLNMKNFEDYRSALEGRKTASDFGIRTYYDMFQKMEDTFKFCVECKKLPDAFPDPKALRRCKRCQNVYYCSSQCHRANWPAHKKFCKKLKMVAIDRLVDWLVFTGDIPFPTQQWTKPISEIKSWDDWFAMQENLDDRLNTILACRYMNILWSNAGKPRPEDGELIQSVKRVTSEFMSRPLTIGFGLHSFSIDYHTKPVTVHVVGASHTETLNARVTDYDELARMFPGNQGIEVVMIGPEVVDGPIMRPPLRAYGPKGRVYVSSFKSLYHIFWETMVETERASRPDIVVGFHPGFHASQGLAEGWLPTLLLLRDFKIPSIFTMYNDQELKYSLQILTELETRITGYGANPFSSLKLEQVQSNPNKQPVCSNAYYVMFYGFSGSTDEVDMGGLEQEEEDDDDDI